MFKLKLILLGFLVIAVQVYADGPVTDGLVLEMDAANPGRRPVYETWTPSVVTEGIEATGEFREGRPLLRKEDGSESGKYIWYYDFDNCMVADIYPEHELVFDYNQPYTVEAWIRVPSVHDDWAFGGATIVGNTDNTHTGWIFGIQDAGGEPPVGNQWCIFMQNRDNEADYSDARVNIPFTDVNNPLDYNDTEWVQIAGTRHGFGFTGDGLASVDYSTYINGVKVSDHVTATDTKAADITDVNQIALTSGTCFAKLGTTRTDGVSSPASNACWSFKGDIALVRVYDRELTDTEVATNYNHGIENTADQQVIRNDFLEFAGLAAEWLSSGKDPYPRVIFSNDTTNTNTCNPGSFQLEYLYESVDVTQNTGIDAHMIQPGVGWVPLWESEVYPIEEHADWYTQRTGMAVGSFINKMLQGKDITWEFLQRCRLRGLSPWVSLRLNDRHQKQYVNFSPEVMQQFGRPTALGFSQWYDEHPEYRLDPNLWDSISGYDPNYIISVYKEELRNANLLNWAIPEVRQQKLDYIREICEYRIDGLELDFERHPYFFRLDETTSAQREDIMTNFISQVREILDATNPFSQHRWLSVRIPFHLAEMDAIGIDVTELADAGVDMLNLSCNYYTEQQNDLRLIHQIVPDMPVYLEVTQVAGTYLMDDGVAYKRYITEEELYTAAHLAYSRGATGITVFNFAYYCMAGYEPPYHVFNIIRDPELVAQQPQHYYLWRTDANDKRFSGISFISDSWEIDMDPPTGGWQQDGRLRIQSAEADAFLTQTWRVSLNGHLLTSSSDISEPYPSPYQEGLAPSDDYIRAWNVPASILVDGINEIKIEKDFMDGTPSFLDIAIQ